MTTTNASLVSAHTQEARRRRRLVGTAVALAIASALSIPASGQAQNTGATCASDTVKEVRIPAVVLRVTAESGCFRIISSTPKINGRLNPKRTTVWQATGAKDYFFNGLRLRSSSANSGVMVTEKVNLVKLGGQLRSVTTAKVQSGALEVLARMPAVGLSQLHRGAIDWSIGSDKKVKNFKVSNPTAFATGMDGTLAGPPELVAGLLPTMRIPYHLVLPARLGAYTTPVPLRATQTEGFATAAQAPGSAPFSFTVPGAQLGPVGFTGLTVTNTAPNDWTVTTAMTLPNPVPVSNLSAFMRIFSGDVSVIKGKAGFSPPLKAGPVSVECLRVEVQLQPTPGVPAGQCEPTADLDFKTGCLPPDAALAEFALCGDTRMNVLGQTINGGMSFADYKPGPDKFRAYADRIQIPGPSFGSLAVVTPAIEVRSNGYFGIKGAVEYGFPDPQDPAQQLFGISGLASVEVKLPGFNLRGELRVCGERLKAQVEAAVEGKFGAVGLGALRALVSGSCIDGGKINISSKGVAMCFETPVMDVQVGVNGSGPQISFVCDLNPYTVNFGARAAQSTARSFTLAAGEQGVAVDLRGTAASGLPNFTVRAPNGSTISTPNKLGKSVNGAVSFVQGTTGTTISIARPAAGKYTVAAAPGTTLTGLSVRRASKSSLKALVKRVNGAYVLRYKALVDSGQRIALYERGADAFSKIATFTKTGEGTVGFVAAEGATGKRDLEVVVEGPGPVSAAPRTIGSYAYTAPTVPPVSAVEVQKVGGSLRVALTRTPVRGLALNPADPGATLQGGKLVPFRGGRQRGTGVVLEPVSPQAVTMTYDIVTTTSDGAKILQTVSAPTVASNRVSSVKGEKLADGVTATVTVTARTPGGITSKPRTGRLGTRAAG